MLALDHIVISSLDPEKSARLFGEKYNLSVVQGGRHENWGTFNWLCYFKNNCYIEWIGIFDKPKANNSDNPLIKNTAKALATKSQGIIQFAFRTEHMETDICNLDVHKILFTGPVAGSRMLPDGGELEWRMLFPKADTIQPLPFLIEWGNQLNKPAYDSDLNSAMINTITIPNANSHLYKKLTDDVVVKLSNTAIILGDNFDFTIN